MALALKVDPAEPHLVRSECRCHCTGTPPPLTFAVWRRRFNNNRKRDILSTDLLGWTPTLCAGISNILPFIMLTNEFVLCTLGLL